MPRSAVLLLFSMGCATTATIVTENGRRTEAFLAGGDKDHLLLRNPYGVETVVRRSEVLDIDYPGNVHALVGGIIAGTMGLELAFFGTMCSAGGLSQSACGLQFGLLGSVGAAGLAMLSWGLWTWLNATSVVRESASGPPLPLPPEPPPALEPVPLVPVPSL